MFQTWSDSWKASRLTVNMMLHLFCTAENLFLVLLIVIQLTLQLHFSLIPGELALLLKLDKTEDDSKTP